MCLAMRPPLPCFVSGPAPAARTIVCRGKQNMGWAWRWNDDAVTAAQTSRAETMRSIDDEAEHFEAPALLDDRPEELECLALALRVAHFHGRVAMHDVRRILRHAASELDGDELVRPTAVLGKRSTEVRLALGAQIDRRPRRARPYSKSAGHRRPARRRCRCKCSRKSPGPAEGRRQCLTTPARSGATTPSVWCLRDTRVAEGARRS